MAGSTALTNKPSVLASTYGAKQFRNAFEAFAAMGVIGLSDFALTQTGGGARSVTVAAGQAYIKPTAVTNQGAYFAQSDAAYVESNFTAADPSNPRVDAVILEIKDTDEDASGLRQAQTRVIDGTPTGGATLANLAGAPAIPAGTLLLGYTLLTAGGTTILTAAIKDKRVYADCGLPSVAGGIYLSVNNTPGSLNRIAFDTAVPGFTNAPGMVDLTNHCLVAPVAGLYLVCSQISQSTGFYMITKNGGASVSGFTDVKVIGFFYVPGSGGSGTGSFMVQLAAGDTVGAATQLATAVVGGTEGSSQVTWVSMRRMGPS